MQKTVGNPRTEIRFNFSFFANFRPDECLIEMSEYLEAESEMRTADEMVREMSEGNRGFVLLRNLFSKARNSIFNRRGAKWDSLQKKII